METKEKTVVTVQNTVNAPVATVWECWTAPAHIVRWNSASDEWHTPKADNDLRVGGSFSYRMEAKDGSLGFDLGGVYNAVKNNEHIASTLGDGRKVKVTFIAKGNTTEIIESFEAEDMNSVDLQKGGWQAILDNFKKYVESGK